MDLKKAEIDIDFVNYDTDELWSIYGPDYVIGILLIDLHVIDIPIIQWNLIIDMLFLCISDVRYPSDFSSFAGPLVTSNFCLLNNVKKKRQNAKGAFSKKKTRFQIENLQN